MACAQMVRLGRPVTQFDPLTKYFGLLSVIFGLMWLGMLAAYGTRSPRIVGAGTEEYRRVLSATMSTIGVVAVTVMIFRPEYARGYLAVAFPLGLRPAADQPQFGAPGAGLVPQGRPVHELGARGRQPDRGAQPGAIPCPARGITATRWSGCA